MDADEETDADEEESQQQHQGIGGCEGGEAVQVKRLKLEAVDGFSILATDEQGLGAGLVWHTAGSNG